MAARVGNRDALRCRFVRALDSRSQESFGRIFRVLGTAGVLAYCFASFPNDIWFQKSPRAILMNFIDGVVLVRTVGSTK